MNESQIRAWLLAYAWSGTDEEKAANVDCIMAQDGWKFIDAKAEQFAGAQFETGPASVSAGMEYALSALYECHDGPHIASCPDA